MRIGQPGVRISQCKSKKLPEYLVGCMTCGRLSYVITISIICTVVTTSFIQQPQRLVIKKVQSGDCGATLSLDRLLQAKYIRVGGSFPQQFSKLAESESQQCMKSKRESGNTDRKKYRG